MWSKTTGGTPRVVRAIIRTSSDQVTWNDERDIYEWFQWSDETSIDRILQSVIIVTSTPLYVRIDWEIWTENLSGLAPNGDPSLAHVGDGAPFAVTVRKLP